MRQLIIYIFFFLLFVINSVIGQVKVGQQMPDIRLKNIMKYNDQEVKISDLKGKAIIFDFYGTWCPVCSISLPKLDSLQKQYSKELQIFVVTKESSDIIRKFFKGNKYLSKVDLPIITSDTILNKLFPHLVSPHEIWIGKDGVVKSITSHRLVTEYNIKKLITGEKLELQQKIDVENFERAISLTELAESGIVTANKISKTSFSNSFPGINAPAMYEKNDSVTYTFSILNAHIIALYERLVNPSFYNKLVLEVQDSTRFIYTPNKASDWWVDNSYCYELSVPSKTSKHDIKNFMKGDFDKYFNLNSYFENREVNCYAVKVINEKAIATKGNQQNKKPKILTSKEIINQPMGELISYLNEYEYMSVNRPIFIDQSKYHKNIDITIPMAWENYPWKGNVKKLKFFLNEHGLDIVPVKAKIKMFVLSDKKTNL